MAIVPNYGTATSLTVTNLHTLGDDNYWQSERLDFGTSFEPVWTQFHINLRSSTVAGSCNGFAEVFLSGGVSTNGLAGGAGSTQGLYSGNPTDSQAVQNADFIGVITMPSSGIVIHNRTGAVLSTESNTVEVLANQVNNT